MGVLYRSAFICHGVKSVSVSLPLCIILMHFEVSSWFVFLLSAGELSEYYLFTLSHPHLHPDLNPFIAIVISFY